jgi:hypothetical protein
MEVELRDDEVKQMFYELMYTLELAHDAHSCCLESWYLY